MGESLTIQEMAIYFHKRLGLQFQDAMTMDDSENQLELILQNPDNKFIEEDDLVIIDDHNTDQNE